LIFWKLRIAVKLLIIKGKWFYKTEVTASLMLSKLSYDPENNGKCKIENVKLSNSQKEKLSL
jgi:hypothetical protein